MALIALTLAGAPAPASAQEGARASDVSRVVGAERVIIPRPDGWSAGVAPKGSILVFRAVNDASAQIEVRTSSGVSAAQADTHFAAFHSTLSERGLRRVETRAPADRGPWRGAVVTEYRAVSKQVPYRLVVVHAHRGENAWFITGFFPEKARDLRLESLDELVDAVRFEAK